MMMREGEKNQRLHVSPQAGRREGAIEMDSHRRPAPGGREAAQTVV